MNIKQRLKDLILGKPTYTPRNVFVEAEQALAANDRLSDDEKRFVRELYSCVQAQEGDTDYEQIAKTAPSDNIEFWYESAVALMLDVDTNDIDIRPHGRLQTASIILSKIMEHSYKVAPFWAQKIAVLDYLATGHERVGDAEKAHEYIQAILDATTEACGHFPDMEWFGDKRQEMLAKYGEA